jgi:hypothetical protein
MQYKTMVLELLKQHPKIHDQLRKKRLLFPALDSYAKALKASHEAWKARLSQAKPGSDPSQIASEALEIALKELEDSLNRESRLGTDDSLSLDTAIAFIKMRTPPA